MHLVRLLLLPWLVALASAAQPFFFLQLTDPQLGMFTENRDFRQDAANFTFAVEAVNRLKPAFVVITGDLTHKVGDPAQIAEYRRIVGLIDRSIPVHQLAGNHDIENEPTPESVAAYVRTFGPDRYVFRHGDLVGLILNSGLIHSPRHVADLAAEQERWLRGELVRIRAEGARHLVVFQHHPWFLQSPEEADGYYSIPRVRRAPYLALLREAGVRLVVSGHYHRNAGGRDGPLEQVTTGPVGKPLGGAKSGLRVFIVREDRIDHRYYELGELPSAVDLAEKPAAAKAGKG